MAMFAAWASRRATVSPCCCCRPPSIHRPFGISVYTSHPLLTLSLYPPFRQFGILHPRIFPCRLTQAEPLEYPLHPLSPLYLPDSAGIPQNLRRHLFLDPCFLSCLCNQKSDKPLCIWKQRIIHSVAVYIVSKDGCNFHWQFQLPILLCFLPGMLNIHLRIVFIREIKVRYFYALMALFVGMAPSRSHRGSSPPAWPSTPVLPGPCASPDSWGDFWWRHHGSGASIL